MNSEKSFLEILLKDGHIHDTIQYLMLTPLAGSAIGRYIMGILRRLSNLEKQMAEMPTLVAKQVAEIIQQENNKQEDYSDSVRPETKGKKKTKKSNS